MHAVTSGLADYLADDEPSAIHMARNVVAHLNWRKLGPGPTSPSAKVVGAWEPYVKNYMPNIGNDYGQRLMAAWLDR
jgi:acetyl-CoA carboxylase carboxyltransferase component